MKLKGTAETAGAIGFVFSVDSRLGLLQGLPRLALK